MKPLPTNHLRIARPSHDLRASERFCLALLRYVVPGRFEA
jgi:hypothetical protein